MFAGKKQKNRSAKRTLVVLLVMVLLASVCLPGLHVSAQETADLTVTEGETATYSLDGLTEVTGVNVSPAEGGLCVTFADGVFSIDAASAAVGIYTVDAACLNGEGEAVSRHFLVEVAGKAVVEPAPAGETKTSETTRSAAAQAFDTQIADLTERVASFDGTPEERTALESEITQLKSNMEGSAELADGEKTGLAAQADALMTTLMAPQSSGEGSDVEGLFNRLMTASDEEELTEMMDELTEDECALLAQFNDEQASAVNAKLGLDSAASTYSTTTYAVDNHEIAQGSSAEISINNRYASTFIVKQDGNTVSDSGISFSKSGTTVTVEVSESTPVGIYTVSYGYYYWNNTFYELGSFTVEVTEKASGGSKGTSAYFFIRDDGVIKPEPASYPNSEYIPVPYNGSSPSSWTAIPNALPENPSAISNNLTAVANALVNKPSEEQIQAALEANGKSYTPGSDYIVWYVIKNEGDWHVDGVVRRHPFLHYNANGGDAETMPDSRQYSAGTVVEVVFKNDQDVVPTKEGYIFLGWADSPDATAPNYTADGNKTLTMPDADKTLYAVWQKENLSSDSGTLTITGEKFWDDKEDANQLRPNSITIQLQGSTDGVTWVDLGEPLTVQANSEGKWTYSFDASEYAYTQFRVREINVPDKYEVTYEDPQVKFTYPAAGDWKRTNTCSTISFDASNSKTTIIVANKGNSYAVWTYYPLTPGEQSLILSSLAGLQGENVSASNCTFFNGIGAHSNGMTVTETGITFDGKSSWSYYYSGTYTPATAAATTSTITNTLATATVTIAKQVKGNMGDPNKSFPFTVTLTGGTMTEGTYGAAGGSVAYTVSENGTKVSFSLADGQSVVLKDVPLNATLRVTETNVDSYAVTIDGSTVKDKGVAGDASKDVPVTGDITVEVVNENEALIDTGITMDSIPYVLLLALSVIGGGVLLSKRRVY